LTFVLRIAASFRFAFLSSTRSPPFRFERERNETGFAHKKYLAAEKTPGRQKIPLEDMVMVTSGEILPSFTRKTGAYLVWLI
jgi:hypothetical protein